VESHGEAPLAELRRQVEEITAQRERIDRLCAQITALLEAGEIWWSWDDRRLHFREQG
jgi:hypothetical protein